ncbi:response regulator [Marinobacter halodurans]|uniref:histidine kinase n=1 Tax=Marinobacter halodurans TaxID=2528979 RepID=A0ABY1ZMC3_9GAMM|nr:ATP-binding protein [Marinobacter halodurans]TBW56006.1 response regulator [Marinobacter halodurans]
MSNRQRPLNRQLLLLGTVPAILMFLVLLIFFTSVRLEDVRRDLFRSTQVVADNLAPAVEYAVVSGNHKALQQILERTLRRSDVSWIRVRDVGGTVVGLETGKGVFPDSGDFFVFDADILQQPLEMDSDSDSELDWFGPGFSNSSGAMRIGSVSVAVSGSRLTAQRQEIIFTSFAVAVSVLIVTLLIINQIAHRISRPIQKLSGNVKKLMEGRYEPPDRSSHAAREIQDLERNLSALTYHLEHLRSSREKTLEASEQARERAESASRAKSEFLAMMSHELRTPLNGVLGMLELVAEDPMTPRQKDYMQTARRATEDLLTVISDILDYSRVERGTLVLEHRSFNLRQLIENCVATHRHECESKGLELDLRFIGNWPDQPNVRGDSGRFRQILAGLLENAIKFTEQGHVSVRSEWLVMEGNSIYLSCEVRDSGSGIPSEHLTGIFNSFEQVDSSASRRYGGTGMGLALVQRLIELMGGHIRVDSSLGSGSAFYFELPFECAGAAELDSAAARPTGKPSEPAALSETASEPLRPNQDAPLALVVEDNEVNQRVACALLRRFGFETISAENGEVAVKLVTESKHTYDIVLMDCQMPVMDGYEAARCIRAWESAQDRDPLPIIALTADALPGTDRACHTAGMNDYLAKPVRKDKLRNVINRWIRLPETGADLS